METKHTPAPWKTAMAATGGLSVDATDPEDGRNFEVCEVWGIDVDRAANDDPRAAANAKLIAAAPELLASLQAFERISDIWLPAVASDEHEGEMQALHHARNDMLAAIAKATA